MTGQHRRSGRLRTPSARVVSCLAAAPVLLVVSIAAGAAVAQTGPSGPADPAVVGDQVRDVMSRPEFSYEPSILDRAMRWIDEQLQRLFGSGSDTSGVSFVGGIGRLVGWLLILVAVAALVFLVVRIVVTRTRVPKRSSARPLSDAEVEHRRRASEWLDDAERLEAAGEWKEAVRARYRHLVRTLVDRRQLPDVPGRTTGELRDDLDRSTPGAADAFDTCCVLFELPWYAGVPTGPSENAEIRAAARRVLDAPLLERFGPLTLVDVAGVGREVDPAGRGAPTA